MWDAATWLDSAELAAQLTVTRRAATKILGRAVEGHLWRGHHLEVRTVFGRGGLSGMSYEVSLRSLSEAIEDRLSTPEIYYHKPSEDRRFNAASEQGVTIGHRFSVIENAVAWPPGTPERRSAIKEAAKAVPERTVRNWIKTYEAHGMAGLGNGRRSNAGQARVIVSREFDRAFIAAGYGAELLAQIGKTVTPSLQGLWASRAEATGWRHVGRLAEFLLLEECERQGVTLPEAAYRLSRRSIERFRHFRVVNQRRNDRKAYDDAKPRITRTWAHLAPMDVIVADVKPLDIIVMREDGSQGWPRVIGFFDPATGRLFVYPVLCDRGEGVRQEHINEAFIAMAMDPEWGFPRAIYTDNGSELKGLEKIDPALQLVAAPGARTIIYAMPYNAAAKPVESAFARLDRYVTPLFAGYAGKDRMVKKTQTVGRPPNAYPHGFEHFANAFVGHVRELNYTPYVSGERRGRSGMDILKAKIEGGWRPIIVNSLALDAAFCSREERQVTRFGVSIAGARYTHAQLHEHIGRRVQIALPWRRSAEPLFNAGTGWSYLTRDTPLPADWIGGARESSRRQRTQDRAVRELANIAPAIDAADIARRKAKRRAPLALPLSAIPIDTGGQLAALAEAKARAPAQRALELTEAQRARLIQDRETEALLREDKANAA